MTNILKLPQDNCIDTDEFANIFWIRGFKEILE